MLCFGGLSTLFSEEEAPLYRPPLSAGGSVNDDDEPSEVWKTGT